MRAKDRSLGYDWRPDGNFLVRIECVDCERQFDCHAMANYTALCPQCKGAQMFAAMCEREYQEIVAEQEEIASQRKPFVVGRESVTPRGFWLFLGVSMLTALGLIWKLGLV